MNLIIWMLIVRISLQFIGLLDDGHVSREEYLDHYKKEKENADGMRAEYFGKIYEVVHTFFLISSLIFRTLTKTLISNSTKTRLSTSWPIDSYSSHDQTLMIFSGPSMPTMTAG